MLVVVPQHVSGVLLIVGHQVSTLAQSTSLGLDWENLLDVVIILFLLSGPNLTLTLTLTLAVTQFGDVGGSRSGHKAWAWLGGISISILSESFHLELLSDGEEGVELVLGDGDLPEVHEAQDGLEVGEAEAVEVEEGMVVFVTPQDGSEEWRAGGEDELVSGHLVISTGQSHVIQIILILQLSQRPADVLLEVIPLQ